MYALSNIKHISWFHSAQHADVHVNKVMIGNKCDMEGQRVGYFSLYFLCGGVLM